MVKTIELQTSVDGCSAQQFFQLVYEHPEVLKQYHDDVNKDGIQSITSWENGTRTVIFSMPLQIPEFVKRMIGVENIRVEEKQNLVWHSSHKFSVTSETSVVNIIGAGRFRTQLHMLVVEDTQAQLCDLVFTVRCSASMPWPMQATIENLMADGAKFSMETYLDFCVRKCQEAAASLQAPAGHNAVLGTSSDAHHASLPTATSSRRRLPSVSTSHVIADGGFDLQPHSSLRYVATLQEHTAEDQPGPSRPDGAARHGRSGTLGTDFFDAVDSFGASPGSRSGYTSPILPGSTRDTPMKQPLLDHDYLSQQLQQPLQPHLAAQQHVAVDIPPALMQAVHRLEAKVQRLTDKVDLVHKLVEKGGHKGLGKGAVIMLVLFVCGLAAALVYVTLSRQRPI